MATPMLVVHNPDGTQDEHELSDELSIGRSEGNALVLTAGGVSRKHARIWVENGQVRVEDTGSANGTFLDGEKLARAATLSPEGRVRIGDYELSLKPASVPRKPVRGGAAANPQPPPGDGPPARSGPSTRTLQRVPRTKNPDAPPQRKAAPGGRARPAAPPAGKKAGAEGGAIEKRGPARLARPEPVTAGPQLRGLTGPWANKRFPIDGALVLGRSPGVGALLDDDSVSRRHAELALTEEGVVLRDLGSANGTLLNGEPVTEEVIVSPGDLIQVGVVELVLEDGKMANVPQRRGGGRAPRSAAAEGPSRGRGALVAGLVAMLLVVGGGAAAFKLTAHPPEPAGGAATGFINPNDIQAQVQELLTQCRSYSSGDTGSDPDWAKAESACNKALDLDPINQDATALIKRVKFEQENFEHYIKGEKAMVSYHEEDALDEFSRITSGSQYYLKVKGKLKDAVAGVVRATGSDCKRYTREGEWETALSRCEKYMAFVCPNMQREDMVPPPGYRIRLTDGRLGRNEWRPKDPMLRLFLQARLRKDPNAAVWECPRNEIVQSGSITPDLDREVQRGLEKLYPQKAFSEPMFLYWKGRVNEAVVMLQKIREDSAKAELHATADELRKGISQVGVLTKAGESALQQDDAIKAADPLGEALKVDASLMKDLAKDKPSYFRRTIQQEMSEGAYKSGKFWADRQDVRRACKIWKTGFGFYKGNVDLSKAILFCTVKAQELFKSAEDCDGLARALELGVDGDGLKEKAEAKKAELKCSP